MQRRRADPDSVNRAHHCRDTTRGRHPRFLLRRVYFPDFGLQILTHRVADVFDLVKSSAAEQDACVGVLSSIRWQVPFDDRWALLDPARFLHKCNYRTVVLKVLGRGGVLLRQCCIRESAGNIRELCECPLRKPTR